MKKLLLGAIGSCLFLAACGGGPLPGEAVANAAALAEEQGSARFTIQMSMDVAGQSVEVDGDGTMDFARQTGEMTITPKGTPGPAAMAGPIQMIFSETVMYMRMEAMTDLLPQGKEWIKIDLQAVGSEAGFDLQQLQQLGGSDPSQQLDYLRGVSDVKEVGSETVRGVETTHYQGRVDFDKVAQKHPEAAESVKRLQELAGIDTVPVEVWIDGDGLPRRMSMEMDMNPDTSTQGRASAPGPGPVSMDMVMEFFDYGVDVDVEIPADSEVLDPSQLQA